MTEFVLQAPASFPVAVTGRMASGKSFVCRKLESLAKKRGVPLTVIDVDRIRIQLLESRRQKAARDIQARLLERFGREIACADGTINRRRLSDIAFSDKDELAFVERTVDPVLVSEIRRRVKRLRGIALVDWALTVERGCLELCEYNVLLVHCSPATQLLRLSGGDLPLWNCRSRIAKQMTHARRLAEVRRIQAQAGRGALYQIETDKTPTAEAFSRLLDRIAADLQAASEGAKSHAG
jgi:dephospho-CoA kinase